MTDKEAQLKAKLLKIKLAAKIERKSWDKIEGINSESGNNNTPTNPKSKLTPQRRLELLNGINADKIAPSSVIEESEIGKKLSDLQENKLRRGVGAKRPESETLDKSKGKYMFEDNAKKYAISTAKAKIKKLKKTPIKTMEKRGLPENILEDAAAEAGVDENQSPTYIAQEHGHRISFRAHSAGNYKTASLNEQSGKYAKYWLLNAKDTNGNGWGIAAHTAKDNMKKFIGRPLVVTASSWHGASEYGDQYEHPYLPTNDITAILDHQEKFRVGSIVDVVEDSHGDWYANVEMLPKFANSRLPPFCSPAIYQLDASEAEGQISKWEALHLAALTENPAYGARIALLKGTCVGTGSECKVQFKSAKQLVAESPCHDNYEMIGTKSKDGRKVPNCVPSKQAKTVCPKKKQKISRLKQRLAYEGGSKYDRQITDLSKNFEGQRDEITKRRPDNLVGRQPKNDFGHTCTNEATCGATSGFLGIKLMSEHGLNHKQVKVEGGMYTGPGGEFSSAGFDSKGTPTVGHEWIRLDDGTIIDGSVGQFMDQKNKINQKQRLRVIPPNAPLQKYYKGHYSRNPMIQKREWYDKNDPLKKGVEKYERIMRKGKQDPTEKVIREVKDPEKKKDLLNRLDEKPNEYGPKNYGVTKPKNFGKKIGKLKQKLYIAQQSKLQKTALSETPLNPKNSFNIRLKKGVKNTLYDPKYVYYNIMANVDSGFVKKNQLGSVQQYIRKNDLSKMRINNPDTGSWNELGEIADIRTGVIEPEDGDVSFQSKGSPGKLYYHDIKPNKTAKLKQKIASPIIQETGEGITFKKVDPKIYNKKTYGYHKVPMHPSNTILIRPKDPEKYMDLVDHFRKIHETHDFAQYTQGSVQQNIPLRSLRNDIRHMSGDPLKRHADISTASGKAFKKGDILMRRVGGTPEKGRYGTVGETYYIEEDSPEGEIFNAPSKYNRRAKLKARLASLGEQNMTYQNSKKVRIHKKKNMEKHDKS